MSLPALKEAIKNALSLGDGSADPATAKQNVANQLATAIDAYIQEQIGMRLTQLPGAIITPCPTPAGPVPTPPVPGPGFAGFTRTS